MPRLTSIACREAIMEPTEKNYPLISVIVPIYNVEKYLARCVDSILSQTYGNLEIILVDDGSTDKSGIIADEYEKKDNRVRVIHKQNGGLSDARNCGIDAARGEYFGFVDSDDYIASDMYETLYEIMIRYGAKISVCDKFDVIEGVDRVYEDTAEAEEFCTDAEEAMKIVLDGKRNYAYAWNKLYKREVFDGIRYPKGKFIEDAFIILELFDAAERVAFTTAKKYYYLCRPNSIMTLSFSPKHLDCIEAHEKNYRYVCEKHPALEKNARMRLYWSRFFVLDKMLVSDNVKAKDYMPHVRYIRGGVPFIVFGSVLSVSRKIAAIVLLFSVRGYRALLKRK